MHFPLKESCKTLSNNEFPTKSLQLLYFFGRILKGKRLLGILFKQGIEIGFLKINFKILVFEKRKL